VHRVVTNLGLFDFKGRTIRCAVSLHEGVSRIVDNRWAANELHGRVVAGRHAVPVGPAALAHQYEADHYLTCLGMPRHYRRPAANARVYLTCFRSPVAVAYGGPVGLDGRPRWDGRRHLAEKISAVTTMSRLDVKSLPRCRTTLDFDEQLFAGQFA